MRRVQLVVKVQPLAGGLSRVGVRSREAGEERDEILPTTGVYSHLLQTSASPSCRARSLVGLTPGFGPDLAPALLSPSPPLRHLRPAARPALGPAYTDVAPRLDPAADPRPRRPLAQPLWRNLVPRRRLCARLVHLAQAHTVGDVQGQQQQRDDVKRLRVEHHALDRLEPRRVQAVGRRVRRARQARPPPLPPPRRGLGGAGGGPEQEPNVAAQEVARRHVAQRVDEPVQHAQARANRRGDERARSGGCGPCDGRRRRGRRRGRQRRRARPAARARAQEQRERKGVQGGPRGVGAR